MTMHSTLHLSKKIAAPAYPAREKPPKSLKTQLGLTLIELMVGLAIGLLVVAVATAALMGTRSVTGTVSDISGIQQQAAYVMRTFGTQLRQAGSLYLDLGLDADGTGDIDSATTFQLRSSTEQAITENEDGAVTVRFTGYEEPTFADNGPIARNCLGAPGDIPAGTTETIESIFTLKGDDYELHCGGNSATAQPIASKVAQFQVRYLVQGPEKANPTTLYANAADVNNWDQVQGVEVCLVLFGTERIDMPTDDPDLTSYTDCTNTKVDMTTLTGDRTNRMHYVFRNVFQLRSQGLI